MTTQYTPTLKLALPVTGELSGTWGDVVNDNITSMIEQAIAGLSTINTWTANAHTLTTANGTTSESRCAMLVAATGAGGTAITGAGEIICPAAAKLYVLQNTTAFAITLKTSAGTGVAVAASNTAFLFCDGTNVNACVTTIVNGNVTGNLTVGGNATINGNTTLGDATSDTITATARFNTDLLPSTDNARDLGSSANSWKDLYIDGTAYLALVDINGGTIDGVSIGSTTAATVINVDNLRLDGNTLSSTDSNGNIVIAPNGTGDVQLDADTVRIGDAAAAVTLTSNGAGALTVTTGGAADITISTNSGTTSGTITIANGANGNITLTPDGTGDVILSADRTQFGDSNTDTTLTTNGTGNLNLSTNNGTNSGTIQIAQGVNGNITLTPNGTGLVSIPSVTISGGTANGVTYLNASKVLTSGSALTFDGANFGVGVLNSGQGKVQISQPLGNTVDAGLRITDNATTSMFLNNTASGVSSLWSSGGNLAFGVGGSPFTEGMRLTATSLYTATGVDVGIGLSNPARKLEVAAGTSGPALRLTNTNSNSGIEILTAADRYSWLLGAQYNVSEAFEITPSTAVGGTTFTTPTAVFTQSGNVGIGTPTPTTNLEIRATSPTAVFSNSATRYGYVQWENTGSQLRIGTDGAFNIRFDTNASQKMLLDSAGNLGLGVDPSAWGAGFKAIDIGPGSALSNLNSGTETILTSNSYRTATDWLYKNSQEAGYYRQASGTHAWYNAPSGVANSATITTGVVYIVAGLGASTLAQWQAFFSALTVLPTVGQSITATATGTLVGGGTVTQTITFTQAMTLDASGNLMVGFTSSSAIANKNIDVNGTGDSAFVLRVGGTTTAYLYSIASQAILGTVGALPITFNPNGTERARISSDGTFRVKGAGTAGSTDAFQVAGTAPASVVSITSGGNLLVGTVGSSDARLYVRGAGTTSATASFEASNSAGSTRLFVQDDGTTRFFGSSGSETARITSGGDFLVGASSAYVSTFSGITAEGKTSGVGNNLALGLFKAGTPQILDGDVLGNIYFYGADNDVTPGNNNIGARIASIATSNWTTDGTTSNAALVFYTHGTTSGAPEERARITSAGDLLVGIQTAQTGIASDPAGITLFGSTLGAAIFTRTSGSPLYVNNKASSGILVTFYCNNNAVGDISSTGTITVYGTTSDYRLKTVLGPVADAGQRIDALQPIEYTWNSNGERTRGFLAHQFQEVYASSVTGSKDAVDAEGKPVYQAMQASTSEVIADLVAELKSLRARVAALESSTLQ